MREDDVKISLEEAFCVQRGDIKADVTVIFLLKDLILSSEGFLKMV